MIDFRDRIQVRAYFLAQNENYQLSAAQYWIQAERLELFAVRVATRAAVDALRAKRSEAAKRGAATKRAKRVAVQIPDFDAYAHLRNAPPYRPGM